MKSFKKQEEQSTEKVRIRLPRGNEIIGTVDERHGGNKMRIKCLDEKDRICRVPGRLKRYLWLRPGDVVIIEPWELDKDKGDVLYKFKPVEISWLKKNGYLESGEEEF